jgi:hypothetical protein
VGVCVCMYTQRRNGVQGPRTPDGYTTPTYFNKNLTNFEEKKRGSNLALLGRAPRLALLIEGRVKKNFERNNFFKV